jgi:hypothetical protein
LLLQPIVPISHVQAAVMPLLMLLTLPLIASQRTLYPTAEQLEIARKARSTKVYVYKFSDADIQPPLASFAHDSRSCTACRLPNSLDPCNNGLGKLSRSSPHSSALQGNVWRNHNSGYWVAPIMHAALEGSRRATNDPEKAGVFFIPFYTQQICRHQALHQISTCGLDFQKHKQPRNLWNWMLKQPSFLKSDGSDHFIVFAEIYNNFVNKVRALLLFIIGFFGSWNSRHYWSTCGGTGDCERWCSRWRT